MLSIVWNSLHTGVLYSVTFTCSYLHSYRMAWRSDSMITLISYWLSLPSNSTVRRAQLDRVRALQLIKPRIKVELGLTQEAGWRGAPHACMQNADCCGCVMCTQTHQKKPQNQEKAWRYPLTYLIMLRCACATWCENSRSSSSCLHPLIKVQACHTVLNITWVY